MGLKSPRRQPYIESKEPCIPHINTHSIPRINTHTINSENNTKITVNNTHKNETTHTKMQLRTHCLENIQPITMLNIQKNQGKRMLHLVCVVRYKDPHDFFFLSFFLGWRRLRHTSNHSTSDVHSIVLVGSRTQETVPDDYQCICRIYTCAGLHV